MDRVKKKKMISLLETRVNQSISRAAGDAPFVSLKKRIADADVYCMGAHRPWCA